MPSTVEAAGRNGTVGVDGALITHITDLTVSGAGYTVTGGVAVGVPKITFMPVSSQRSRKRSKKS